MEIFWIENGERKGPLPIVEIISLIQRGELSPDTKGWHEGCTAWVPLKQLPALSGYLSDPDDSSDESGHRDDPTAKLVKVVIVPPQGIRLIARLIDVLAVFCIVSLPIPVFGLPFNETYFLLIGSCPFLILYDAFFLAVFGTSPGKALLNIKVLRVDETKMSFTVSSIRAIYVYILGLGFMTFPFLPILPLFSWFLTYKNGVAPWDLRLRLATFITGKITLWRMLACAWITLMLLYTFSFNLLPWEDDLKAMLPPGWDFTQTEKSE